MGGWVPELFGPLPGGHFSDLRKHDNETPAAWTFCLSLCSGYTSTPASYSKEVSHHRNSVSLPVQREWS